MARYPRSTTGMVLVLCAMAGGCTASRGLVPSESPLLDTSSRPAGGASQSRVVKYTIGHVYVGDYGGAVFRYPLVNGKMAAQPDSSITSMGGGSGTVAVEGDGTVFAYDYSARQINVYAPGAQGNAKPIRTLNVLHFPPYNIEVDAAGYLYVATGPFQPTGIFIFAPSAGGNAQPVASISQYTSNLAVDNATGYLYAVSLNGTLSVFATPTTNPTLIRQTCLPNRSIGIALGTQAVYTSVAHLNDKRNYIVVLPRKADGCPAPPHGLIYTSPALRNPVSESFLANSLFVADTGFGSSASILQLDARELGKQTPLNVVSGPPLAFPWNVKLGP